MRTKVTLVPTPTSSMMTGADMEQAKFAGNDPARPNYQEAKNKMNWPTPNSRDWKGSGFEGQLPNEVKKKFPTPRGSEGGVGLFGGSGSRQMLLSLLESNDITEDEFKAMQHGGGGNLNSSWVEWLMGWPIGWTDLKPLPIGNFNYWLDEFLRIPTEWWIDEPKIPRLINNIPFNKERLMVLGNGWVVHVIRASLKIIEHPEMD